MSAFVSSWSFVRLVTYELNESQTRILEKGRKNLLAGKQSKRTEIGAITQIDLEKECYEAVHIRF